MTSLISRTKDRRFLPLLLAQFEKGTGDRSTLINMLSQVGDETMGKVFVEKYDDLKNHEKSAVLNALRQVHAPEYKQLAGKALLSSDSSLINTAVRGLQEEADDEAVKLLVAAFEKNNNTAVFG